MYRGEEPLFSLAREAGVRFVDFGPGRAVFEVEITPRFHNPSGVAHGGVLFGLLDTCMGFAATSVLEGPTWASTVSVTIHFLRAVREGRVRCEGTVARRGRSILHLEGNAWNDKDELVAQALAAAAIVEDKPSRPD